MLTQLSKHVFFPLWELKDGAHRARYLRELSASQWLDAGTLRQRQWERVRETVSYAFRHCPYYQSRFSGMGFKGDLRDWSEFRRLPVLTKLDIRANESRLLSREMRREDLVEARTGGSTGVALVLHFDQRCQEMRNAAAMRSDQWAGWDIGMKVAAVWGNPPIARTWKSKLRSLLLERTIYLDTMNLSEQAIRAFVGTWRREKPEILFGHSHSIYLLAKYLQRMGIADIRPRGVVSTSMMLLEPERNVIEAVLGCPVTNRYGCEEVGLIACECERHEGLHLNVDHVCVEFLKDDGSEAKPGEEADIVVTDLVNRGMPLIRYRVGDVGVPTDRTCSCGRGLPLMERLIGRQADFLKRVDGSLVAGVSLVERTLTAIPGIEQLQLVQDDLRCLNVRIVRDHRYTDSSEHALRAELESVFGDEVRIDLQYVPVLDQTRTGKYRFAVCNV
jgi:phenylacetate-CoA ligase